MDPTTPENTFAYNVTQDEAPEVSTYKFSYEVPGGIVAGEEVEVDVTFATVEEGDYGYEGVRFKFAAQGPEGATVTFKAVDSNNVEHSFTNEGYWGPADGFDIPAEYTATTDWTLVFSKAGQYTITFSLIDADTEEVIAGITDSATVEVGAAPEEPAVIASPGVSPEPGSIEGDVAFTFGFKSVTGELQELELDIYLGENTGEGRNYAQHLGINLPAGSDAVATWVDGVVEGYDQLDEKYHSILAAAGYNAEAGDDDNKQALKENIFYTGDEKAGTWTIKLDTAVLDVEAIEFLVAVRDDQGAQWGNNNYVSYPNDVKAFLYNVTLPEPAITMTAGEPTIEDGKVTLAVTTKNTGADYENARYGIKVNAAGVEGDTISVSYGDEGLTFNLTRVEGSDDFIGYFGPADGFTITKGWDVTTTFTVDFGTAASDRTVKVDAWVNQGAEPAEEDAVAKMEQLEITIPAAEPEEYHTYKFKIEDKADEYIVSDGLVDPTDADFAGMTPVKLSIVVDSEKDKAYGGNVRVAPVNADGLQLWAKDTAGKWHDINQVGWGPSEGFVINPELVTPVYVIATKAFEGNVTLKLIDIDGDYGAEGNIIISQEVAVKAVVDEQAQAIAAVNEAGRDDMLAVLNEYAEVLELDFGDLTEGGRREAVADSVNFIKEVKGAYESAAAIKEVFDKAVATERNKMTFIRLVNETDAQEAAQGLTTVLTALKADAEAVLEEFDVEDLDDYYGEGFSANLEAAIELMDSYLGLDEADKEQVAAAFIANEYSGSDVVVMGYLQAAMAVVDPVNKAVAAVNEAGRDDMLAVLNEYAEVLELDFGDLTEGGRREAVADSVNFIKEVKGAYESAAAIKEVFDKAVATERNKMTFIRLVNETDAQEAAQGLTTVLTALKADAEAVLELNLM
jgi:uncharacterized protein YifE (UPF0438 family)